MIRKNNITLNMAGSKMFSNRNAAFNFGLASLLAFITIGVHSSPTFAAAATWDGSIDANWSSTSGADSNWGGGLGTNGRPASGDSLVFTSATGLGGTALVDDLMTPGTFNVAGITFNSGSPAYTIGPFTSGTNGFTLTGNITNNSTSLETINDLIAITTARTITMTTGGGNVTLAGVISGSGGAITTGGTGTLTLSGANTYTGNTTLNAQTLNINNNTALGTGTLVINSGSAIINNTSGSAKTLTNTINFNNTLTFTGTNDLTFGLLNLSGGAARNLVANAGRITFTNGANFSTGRLQKTGAGTLVLNAAGQGAGISVPVGNATGINYTETARLDAGTVEIGNSSAFLNGTVEFRSGTLTANTPVTLSNNILFATSAGGPGVLGGSNNMTFTGPVNVSNGAAGGVYNVNITNTGSTIFTGSVFLTDRPDQANNNTLAVDVAGTAGATEFSGTIQDHTVSGFATSVGSIRKTNTGLLKLSGASTYTGTTDVQNGTLQLTGSLSPNSTLSLGNSTNSGKFILGGSGGAVNQSVARLITVGTGLSNAVVGGNGSVSTLTVNGTTSATFAGILGGAGTNENNLALTKDGTSTLTLSGVSTYTGPTNINAGKLVVTGSVNNSAISLNSGTLDGTGSVGATTIVNNPSSIITNGNGGTSALSLSSLSFGGQATGNIRVAQATPTVAGLAVSGPLSTTPANGLVTINAATDNTTWTNGTYNLISYGSFGGSLSDFTLGTVAGKGARQNAALLLNGNNLALSLTGDSPKWTGLDGSNWQVGSTGGNGNWKLITAGTATDYIDGDVVLFDDSAAGTTNVNISSGSIGPASITFNNSTKNYTVTGTGGGVVPPTGGGGSLTKNGTGSVTIGANLSFSGPATINSGTVTLSGSNTYTGGTVLNGGTLNVGSASALGSGTVTIGAGSAKTLDNSSGGALAMTGITSQTWNDDFTFAGTNDLDMGNVGVTLSGASRTINVNGSKLTVGGLNGSTTTALVLNGPGTLAITNSTVGGLSGNGNFVNSTAASGRLTVNQNTDSTFSGTMNNGPNSFIFGLTKQGTAKLTLSGVNTYTADTGLNGGTLVVANPSALQGTNRVNFGATATLQVAIDSDFTNTLGIGLSSGNTATIISDRATPGPAVDRTMTTPSGLGNGQMNFTAGANVTSGVPRITFNLFSLAAGSAGTTTVNPTGVNLSLGPIAKTGSSGNQAIELGGTSTGNEVFGLISNNLATTSVIKSGTSTWALSSNNTYTGTTTINAGTLVVGNGGSSGTLGTGAVTNNGALSYNRSDTFNETHAIGGTGNVNQIGSGQTTLTATSTYTGSTSITSGTLALSGTGAINASSGITINGPTAKFLHIGSVASTVPISLTQGNLDGTGSVGATTVADLSTNAVANGNGGTSTLTLSALTFGGDATVNAAKAVGATPLIVTNALTTTPANGQVTINAAGSWTNGPNNLIGFGSFGGSISNFTLGSVTGLMARQTAGALVLNGNNIALTINSDILKWSGLDDGNWATGLNGTNKNWRLTSNNSATDFLDGDEVSFADTYSGATPPATTAVDLGSNVSPVSATFNNSALNYTLGSTFGFGIVDSASPLIKPTLVKSGTGSLTINTFNSHTGGTLFNGGTLNLGNSGALGNGSFTIGAGSAKTLDNTAGFAFTLSTVTSQAWNDDFSFAGSNDLDMGTGAVTLSGATRTVTVNAGRLSVGGINGGTTTSLAVNGPGTLSIGNSTVAGLSGTGNISNNSSGSATLSINQTANTTFSGVLSDGPGGTLALTRDGTGSLTLSGANTYSGATNIHDGATIVMAHPQGLGNTSQVRFTATLSAATLDIATDGGSDSTYKIFMGSGSTINIVSDRKTPGPGVSHPLTTGSDSLTDTLGGGTINFTSGANVTSGSGNISFDQLNVSAGAAGNITVLNPTTATVTIGTIMKNKNNPAQTIELSGTNSGNQITGSIFNGSSTAISLTKSGTSTWTLSGDSSYTGGTSITGGKLLVNNSTGSGLGNGPVTVSGGTLGGTGAISGAVTVNSGGTVAPGASIESLDVGSLILNAGSSLSMELGAPGTSDVINVTGSAALALNGGSVNLINAGGLAAGTYTLIDYLDTFTGSVANLGTPTGPAGFSYTLQNNPTNTSIDLVVAVASVAGDHNGDTRVNAADYVTWRKDQAGHGGPSGYTAWRQNFGTNSADAPSLSNTSASVPEPATGVLVCLCLFVVLASRKR